MKPFTFRFMPIVYFRFYEELNDYLPEERRKKRFTLEFQSLPTVGHVIDSLEIPREPIDLVLINGKSVDLSQKLHDRDEVSVYPEFESLDIGPLARIPQRPLRNTRFVLDVHLGKLARKLRLLGLDCLYRNDFTDRDLIDIMTGEKRILLTRDRRLLENKKVIRGHRVIEENPNAQTVEILKRFDLLDSLRPFTRCLECNQILEKIEKSTVFETLPAKTRQSMNLFYQCPGCERIYWRGTHFERMRRWVAKIKKQGKSS